MDLSELSVHSRALTDELKTWRRDFHQHPELGFQEHRTSAIIADHLRNLGYQVLTGIAETGVIGLLEGEASGADACIMLRFDMDALPIQEETGAEYASRTPGIMHACGHDGHMAIGMGVASVMQAVQKEWPGVLKLVFQPAEEGPGGAERMIREGALENPAPDRVAGMHLWNEREVGWAGVTLGPVMAGCDKVYIQVHGRGGHGAMPSETHDPILAAAQIITGLQHLVSRVISPFDPAVISITRINGGEAFNIIPSTIQMEGTMRAFSLDVRQKQVQGVHLVAENIARAMGCEADVSIERITPPVVNAKEASEDMVDTISALFPDYSILMNHRVMASEDIAYFLEKVPGCYIFLGSANPGLESNLPHHSATFDFDERVLADATAVLSSYAYRYLIGG